MEYDRTDIGAFEFELVSGDLSGDGRVDLSDAVLALQVMAGLDVHAQFDACLEQPPEKKRVGMDEVIYIFERLAARAA